MAAPPFFIGKIPVPVFIPFVIACVLKSFTPVHAALGGRKVTMRISLIAAMSENRVIGRCGAIPWDVPADRKRFRELTTGHTLIMGRKTFESIGRPLPGRTTIILTRQGGYRACGCLVAHDLRSALLMAGDADEVFVCGGGEVYREVLPLAERVYVTIVHGEFEGDAFFPAIPDAFIEVERKEVEAPLPYTFITYQRLPGSP
ncbi:MAG: dihydrofolate [Geobacteraceae bacterium]|nr:MAG: dihydrofolate [Geobacteraceae bacterium]